ncbi:MAG: hypothetical protein FJ095_02270 [Deltaproteobacteria bacterium]|nr:hypothetical protein [Deltaproteobacteria bacterium]
MVRSFEYDAACESPFELVEVEPRGTALPENLRERVLIFTVHDGNWLPPHLIRNADGMPRVEPTSFHDRYVAERDWGANLVASSIASALGLRGYARCNVARVLLDFNRFPGSTQPGNRDPLERLAINDPFSSILDHQEKMEVLGIYDRISDLFERHWLSGNLLMLGVHTYDARNKSQTIRPDLSLVTCSATYLRESRMPYGVFDPMYPDVLAESTCSRVLRDRISLDLERARFRVLHNHPYALPEGSVEVRAQVWYFFDYLRRRYTEACPETRDCPAHALVWSMLLNTNLRIHDAETLRGHLHRFRRLPDGEADRYRAAQLAYDRVHAFLDSSTVLNDYRRSRERPSCMAMEVRKDLLCDLDPRTGHPGPLTAANRERARVIGDVIARAIKTYFDQDRAIG